MRALQMSAPAEGLPRREFLWQSGVTGAGLALAGCVTGRGRSDAPVAVVGGGVAGLTAAYRLQKAGRSVHLYEASQRLGGRMFTRHQFNADGQFVELGAELVDTGHKDLIRLARELGLRVQNLLKGDPGHDTLWFDGRAYSEGELLRAFRPLGERIAADAKGLYDADGEFTEKARLLDQISLADYLADRACECEPWVIQLIIAAYEPEFGVEAARQSSLNLVDFINPDTSKGFQVFGDSDEAWRIEGGNSRLSGALAAKLGAGITEVRLERRLRRIDEVDGAIRLEFATEKGPAAHSYDRVIMALPFTVLRQVAGVFDLPLSEDKKRCIQEMGYGNNVKVFRSFRSRVWRAPGRPPANGSVFAEARTFQNVWETSRGQTGERGILTNLLGGRRATGYSEAAMAGYLDELDAVFPGIKAAYDGKAGSMNWPKVSTALGSYSAPLVGQYTWINAAAARTELGGRLVFAGEHTSLVSPGFMNGGVESGNRAAREVLKGA